MPRYQVELLEEAEADARGSYAWMYVQSPANAEKFANAMEEAVLDLGESAHVWDAKREFLRGRPTGRSRSKMPWAWGN